MMIDPPAADRIIERNAEEGRKEGRNKTLLMLFGQTRTRSMMTTATGNNWNSIHCIHHNHHHDRQQQTTLMNTKHRSNLNYGPATIKPQFCYENFSFPIGTHSSVQEITRTADGQFERGNRPERRDATPKTQTLLQMIQRQRQRQRWRWQSKARQGKRRAESEI